jgi:hypothetical protein
MRDWIGLGRSVAVAVALAVGWAGSAGAVPIVGGTTVVTPDLAAAPNFVSVATENGIAPAAIPPGTLGGEPLGFAFPITSVSATNVLHSGGISLTQDATTLMLTEFDVNLTSLILFGTAMLGDTLLGVVPLFNVDGATLGLSLTSEAATALNSVFSTGEGGASMFGAGLPVGVASFASPVAEPSAFAMFASGLVGMLLLRRRVAV